jgi:protein ImuA
MLARPSQRETVEALRQRLQGEAIGSRQAFASGLSGNLPAEFRRGSLVEFLADAGAGATAVALLTAREACREGGALVVVDRMRTFYPPAAALFGVTHETIFVRPRSRKDELWALNQTLRCPGVGAAVCWLEAVEERAIRGLQVVAEQSGAVGLFIRPVNVCGRPTWSDVQLRIEAMPSNERQRRLRIEVVRSRSGHAGASAIVELEDDATTHPAAHLVPVVSELAAATHAARSSSA